MRASCSAELIAPTSVFLSSGSPTRSVAIRRLSRCSTSSATDSWTSSREPGAADVALVEEDAVDDALDGLVERGVVEDDVGRLAAELERDPLVGAGDGPRDRLADLGRAGERDLVDVGVPDQRLAGPAGAGDDVDDARRQVGLLADLREQQRGQRRGLGRLEHHGVAAGERGRDLPGQHQQREVPRDDLAGHAERRARRSRRTSACRPSRRSRRSAPTTIGTSTSRDSLIGLPLSIDSSTASSRERSCDDPGDPVEVLRALASPGIRDPRPCRGRGARP